MSAQRPNYFIMPFVTGLVRSIIVLATLSISPAISANALQAALTAEEARQFTKAEQLLQSIPDHSETELYHLARVQYRAGDWERSNDTLEKLHELAPTHAEGHYLAGLVNLGLIGEVNIFRKVGFAERALASWEAAVTANPDHIDARYAIFAFYASAPGIAGGDLDKARMLQKEINQLDAGYGAMAEALLLGKEDKPAATEAAFVAAIKHLDRAGPHFALAQFYLQSEQYAKALSEIEQYQQKEKRWWDPEPAVINLVLAHAQNGLGKTREAKAALEAGLNQNPHKRIRKMLQQALGDL